MQCPQCQFQQADSNPECLKCGVIFEKYFSRQQNKAKGTTRDQDDDLFERNEVPVTSLWDLFFWLPTQVNWFYFSGRAVLFIVMVTWGVQFMSASIESNYAGHSFMHLINLPFHEAGHIFFMPFGSFMTSLGGSLGQLLMPLVCLGVLLLKTRDPFGASVSLWWFAQNFFDLAPYINDARSGTLPLLGGNTGQSSPYGFHDWQFILTESHLLKLDHFLARLSAAIGTVLMFVSFLWAAILLYKQYRAINEGESYRSGC